MFERKIRQLRPRCERDDEYEAGWRKGRKTRTRCVFVSLKNLSLDPAAISFLISLFFFQWTICKFSHNSNESRKYWHYKIMDSSFTYFLQRWYSIVNGHPIPWRNSVLVFMCNQIVFIAFQSFSKGETMNLWKQRNGTGREMQYGTGPIKLWCWCVK